MSQVYYALDNYDDFPVKPPSLESRILYHVVKFLLEHGAEAKSLKEEQLKPTENANEDLRYILFQAGANIPPEEIKEFEELSRSHHEAEAVNSAIAGKYGQYGYIRYFKKESRKHLESLSDAQLEEKQRALSLLLEEIRAKPISRQAPGEEKPGEQKHGEWKSASSSLAIVKDEIRMRSLKKEVDAFFEHSQYSIVATPPSPEQSLLRQIFGEADTGQIEFDKWRLMSWKDRVMNLRAKRREGIAYIKATGADSKPGPSQG